MAGWLELGDDEQALIRKRHMFTDGRPAQLAVSYIPLSVAGSIDLAFPDTGPTGIHARQGERGHRVERFVEEVESGGRTRKRPSSCASAVPSTSLRRHAWHSTGKAGYERSPWTCSRATSAAQRRMGSR